MSRKNRYEVYIVTARDPYELLRLREAYAVSGSQAIAQVIEQEEEDGGLRACDLVAFPTWAAQREHYEPSVEALVYEEGPS